MNNFQLIIVNPKFLVEILGLLFPYLRCCHIRHVLQIKAVTAPIAALTVMGSPIVSGTILPIIAIRAKTTKHIMANNRIRKTFFKNFTSFHNSRGLHLRKILPFQRRYYNISILLYSILT